ncbi:composite domain of metallo-dependent hydrolase [Auriculariales sp. MPI-PUGE-AT-0066]|nr:composite domain of metallo-dependent hydrolase [Auriculariales sp. MPI-PUGE-AT-0066]
MESKHAHVVPMSTHASPRLTRFNALLAFVLVAAAASASYLVTGPAHPSAAQPPLNAQHILQQCSRLDAAVYVPSDFALRTVSDRFVPGTRALLVKNATVWTGNHDGKEVLHNADVFLDKGIIKFVGKFRRHEVDFNVDSYDELDAGGAWLTPGIVDLHSHIGVYAAPSLVGASDGNSIHGVAQPWLRSLDGLNTHDLSYHLSIAGGVTTALILPGSANAIGGQAFPIKLRDTAERSVSSKLLEPAFTYNGSGIIPAHPPRWRYLKQACGENPSRVYRQTRMDNLYSMRNAYTEARKVRDAQDAFCLKATAGQWGELGDYPESLQWEALVDVLRGRVKVNTHCYEAVDLDDLVRLSNEFKFKIAAFHHAHETYLVPDVLKKAYGGAPVSAIFATHARYKREAYRGSEFAAKILAENGLKVVLKSDHPVLDSRHLVFEAQQAHYYGLPANLALAGVTSTSADAMGKGHRIGYIRKSYDADLVLWDTHPLSISATPKQVIIDGIIQLKTPYNAKSKPTELQQPPPTPNFDEDARKAVEYEGLPPLEAKTNTAGTVVFANVSTLWQHAPSSNSFTTLESAGNVVVTAGKVVCTGACAEFLATSGDMTTMDLAGGSLAPALISYGSAIGLQEIPSEATTQDGLAPDVLLGRVPSLVGGDGAIVRAVDGLQFGGRDPLLGYMYGVGTAITAPVSYGMISGLSTAFALGAPYKLARGAVLQRVVALHASVAKGGSLSVSTQIAALRNLLHGGGPGELGEWFKKAGKGEVPLIIDVEGADEIATLIELKSEVESAVDGGKIKLSISGAAEGHILATELAAANIGVILTRPRPHPGSWSQIREMPGHPLSEESAIEVLVKAGVTVAVGESDKALVRSARFELAWIYFESGGQYSKSDVIKLGTTNVASILGLDDDAAFAAAGDLVAYHGGDIFDLSARPVGAVSAARGIVDLF